MASKDKNAKKTAEKKPAQRTLKRKAPGQEVEEVARAGAASSPLSDRALPRRWQHVVAEDESRKITRKLPRLPAQRLARRGAAGSAAGVAGW